MKAFTYTKYGPPDVLQLTDISIPTPSASQVLLKVHAVALNAYDWHMLTADIFLVRFMGEGLRRPKHQILVADVSGTIAAVGQDVTQFKPGDFVFGDIAGSGSAGFAEYALAHEKQLALKPSTIDFAGAAAVPMAGITALQGLRDLGKLQSGQKVMIQGASGGVGTFAVQIAKILGAEVSATCSSTKLDLARSLGAGRVIDYTKKDFTRGSERYDVILGVNGYHSLPAYKRVLTPNGIYVMAGGKPSQIFQAVLLAKPLSQKNGKKLISVSAHQSQADLVALREWIDTSKLAPVIDRSFPFAETPDAMRYLGAGHARGKIVIIFEGA
jgi:NADPH:quinone reductase-like Zn-dependent oxidoreductase